MGFVTSVGGMTKSLAKDARVLLPLASEKPYDLPNCITESGDALMKFLHTVRRREEGLEHEREQEEAPFPSLRALSSSLVQIFKRNLHNDRVTIPLMNTLQVILADGVLSPLQPPRYCRYLRVCFEEEKRA